MKPHAFHPAAEHYAGINPELGRRFYDQVERLIRDIRRHPQQYRLFDPPIRRHFSDVFPYAVLHVDQPDRVLVIAIMHRMRRPGYWRKRL